MPGMVDQDPADLIRPGVTPAQGVHAWPEEARRR